MTASEFLAEKLQELQEIYSGFIRLAVVSGSGSGSGSGSRAYWHIAFDERLSVCRSCETWDQVITAVRHQAAKVMADPIYLGM